ncbi:MAG: glycosyltransferase family 1 protein [Pseudomonadales bacterium]|nr:glycosyltransferase family 1 protein [Pseudomonadales bacterium]
MRLLLISDAWHPQVNGVVRALSTIRDRAAARGIQVEVLGPDRFRSLPCPTYPEIRLALSTPARIARIIDEVAPDAVHIATEGPLGLMVRRVMKQRGLPFTTSFHTLFPDYLQVRFGLPARWTFAGLRRFHAGAAATMYSTPTLCALLESHGFSNLVQWVRGVDTELFRPVPPVELNLPKPIQLFVGRIAVEKGLEDFLKLTTPGSKVLIGDGPQLAELKRRYPHAHFLGARFGEDLVAHYSAADVFVFPSRTDTLGLVMLEAMACGVPVAAFPVMGPLDVVADSGAGHLDTDLAAAIEGAIGIDPALCRARALAHSWDESLNQFLDNLVPFTQAKATRATAGPATSDGSAQAPLPAPPSVPSAPGINQIGEDQARS